MTFDQWNREETQRIASREGADVAKVVRKARNSGAGKFLAYADYVDYCYANDLVPEAY